MPFESLSDDPSVQRLIGLAVAGGFVALSFVVWVGATWAIALLSRGSGHGLAAGMIRAARFPAVLLLAVGGVFLGLAAIPDTEAWRSQISKGWVVVATILGAYAVAAAARAGLRWYIVAVAPRTATEFDDRMLPLVRRILTLSIYGIALLILLDALGWSISPILGGLGITGLAVALALQPTLNNFFAGTYVLSEGTISVGDYIELQGGPAGYVVEVGWRSTKIRTWLNNLVLIPNAVMADSVITNYSAPDPSMNILVACGVSYDSDLAHVERVSLEVAKQVIADEPAAVKSADPYFGFEKFADSNIEFWLFLQAKDRLGSFVVTNELIKRLQVRFNDEGIEINYPVRRIITDASGPQALGGPASAT